MKSTIEAFEALQNTVFGYVQYKVRGAKAEWFVDVYTRNGLFVKTKLPRASEEAVREWVDRCTHELTTAQGIHNVHSD